MNAWCLSNYLAQPRNMRPWLGEHWGLLKVIWNTRATIIANTKVLFSEKLTISKSSTWLKDLLNEEMKEETLENIFIDFSWTIQQSSNIWFTNDRLTTPNYASYFLREITQPVRKNRNSFNYFDRQQKLGISNTISVGSSIIWWIFVMEVVNAENILLYMLLIFTIFY